MFRKGQCVVEFPSREDLQQGLTFGGSEVYGRVVHVKVDRNAGKPRRKKMDKGGCNVFACLVQPFGGVSLMASPRVQSQASNANPVPLPRAPALDPQPLLINLSLVRSRQSLKPPPSPLRRRSNLARSRYEWTMAHALLG